MIIKCKPLFHVRYKHLTRMTSQVQRFVLPDGENYIGYKQRLRDVNSPGVIFCSGFLSSLNATKACFLEDYCERNNLSYLRFDYFGHEFSSGSMDDFSITSWKKNTLDVLDNLTKGPQIMVGSSIGGWMSLLVAIERRERIHSIVGIANAADIFYTRLSGMPQKEMDLAKNSGYFEFKSEYFEDVRVPFSCLEDSSKNRVLNSEQIPISCPVRLLHGMSDNTIPYENSIEIANKLQSNDVKVNLVKKADHQFSSSDDLKIISETLDELISKN